MYVQYGGYTHPANEVSLASFEVRPKLSPRGRRESIVYRAHLHGVIVENNTANTTKEQQQAAIALRISEIIDAYQYDNQDFYFRHDDGTPTRHSLVSNDSISGVKIMHRSWPKGNGTEGEYATCRTFYIVLQAEYLDPDSQLIYFKETLQHVSTSGPCWRMVNTQFGPVPHLIYPATHQSIVQSGYAIGLQGYPLSDIVPIIPGWEHLDMRQVTPGTAQSHTNGYTHFPITWTFHFSLPSGGSYIPFSR